MNWFQDERPLRILTDKELEEKARALAPVPNAPTVELLIRILNKFNHG